MKMMDRVWFKRVAVMIVALAFAPVAYGQQQNLISDEELTYEGLPQFEDGQIVLPDLAAPTIATEDIGNGRIPTGFRGDESYPLVRLPESGSERADSWAWSHSVWAAANTFSHPRYFEDRMLERHGQERWGLCQPVVGGARFFATFPMLPYLMATRNPCDCEYTMGYYRVGSPTPIMMQRPPYERRGVIAQGLTTAGVLIAFP